MNGLKRLISYVFLSVLLACSSPTHSSLGQITPEKTELLSEGKFGAFTPKSSDEHSLYLSQQFVIGYDGDWHTIFQNWILPRLDSFHSYLIQFPEGEEHAYHGRNALNDGFNKVCAYHVGAVKLSDVYYNSSRRDCIVGGDNRFGHLTMRNTPAPPVPTMSA